MTYRVLVAVLFSVLSTVSTVSMKAALAAGPNGSANLGPGQWKEARYSGSTGSRDFFVYIPQSVQARPTTALPLMVMLHGCSQDARTFAADTGMNQIAEKNGFIVLYPQQDSSANSSKCWNWFDPESQRRGGGELAIVVGMIQMVAKSITLDHNRIYVAGLSAGAALASNLAACYADVFSGAGIASGLAYKAATSQTEAFMAMSMGASVSAEQSARDAVQCTGTHANPLAILSIQGASDPFVKPVNADKIVEQFTDINDLLDDGQDNHSQNLTAIANQNGTVPNGYKYSFGFYGGNGAIHVGRISVEGMSHAWSGSPISDQYADPKGPNFSEILWQFLTKYGVARDSASARPRY